MHPKTAGDALWNTEVRENIFKAVGAAGDLAKVSDRGARQKEAGHRSIETAGDNNAQGLILSSLEQDSDMRFLCEEKSGDQRVFTRNNPKGIFAYDKVLIVDPIDGSVPYASRDGHWVVGAGLMERGRLIGSALYAPEVNGGTFCRSFGDAPVFVSENDGPFMQIRPTIRQSTKQSILYRGVDTELYRNAILFSHEAAPNFLAVYTRGSGLYGLMQVALGRAQAILQTPQKAWDWAPAYHAITMSGNVFQFFRIIKGNIVPVETFDYKSFCFEKDQPDNLLGFIAGEPWLVGKLFEKLPRSGWERIDSETVKATWDDLAA